MATILPIPHKLQQADGYCLPACVQMVLAYLGVSRSQDKLGRRLGLRPPFGVPTPNIKNLKSRTMNVVYEAGTLTDIQGWLSKGSPVIAFVQTGELPFWNGRRFQHAVVVVGLERQIIYLFDPGQLTFPIATSVDDFYLAWDEMDNTYAVLVKTKS